MQKCISWSLIRLNSVRTSKIHFWFVCLCRTWYNISCRFDTGLGCSKYSGDLNTGLVWCVNGPEFKCHLNQTKFCGIQTTIWIRDQWKFVIQILAVVRPPIHEFSWLNSSSFRQTKKKILFKSHFYLLQVFETNAFYALQPRRICLLK